MCNIHDDGYLFYVISGQRKSNTFLDVPSSNYNHVSDNEDDIDRLRTFSSSKGGKYYKSNYILLLYSASIVGMIYLSSLQY